MHYIISYICLLLFISLSLAEKPKTEFSRETLESHLTKLDLASTQTSIEVFFKQYKDEALFYEVAAHLVNEKQYDLIHKLAVTQSPNTQNYWRGMVYYKNNEFKKASTHFKSLYNSSPSDKNAYLLALVPNENEALHKKILSHSKNSTLWGDLIKLVLIKKTPTTTDELDLITNDSVKDDLRYITIKNDLLIQSDKPHDSALFLRDKIENSNYSPEELFYLKVKYCDALIESKAFLEATKTLTSLAIQPTYTSNLELVFSRLYLLNFFNNRSRLPSGWSTDLTSQHYSFSRYCLGLESLKLNKFDEAKNHVSHFIENTPDSSWLNKAKLELALCLIKQNQDKEALDYLIKNKSAFDTKNLLHLSEALTAMVHHKLGNHSDSRNLFLKTAENSSSKNEANLRTISAFNAASVDIINNPLTEIEKDYAGLVGDTENDLLLARGLETAKRRLPDATKILQEYLQNTKDKDKKHSVSIAMAELNLLSFPPKPRAAQKIVDQINNEDPNQTIKEKIDYLSIWINESISDTDKLISSSLEFITNWKESPNQPGVRMKLADLYFNQKRFTEAKAQYLTLSKEHPNSNFCPHAILKAGESAVSLYDPNGLDEGIQIWSELAKKETPMGATARYNQAVAKIRQGKSKEALLVINDMLNTEPKNISKEMIIQSLLTKSEIIMSFPPLNETSIVEITNCLKEIAIHSEIGSVWDYKRRQQLTKSHLLQNQTDLAKKVCYDALDLPITIGPESIRKEEQLDEYYKIGFNLIDLLENDEEWIKASDICNRLARTSGNRSIEATQVGERLRLKHFIW